MPKMSRHNVSPECDVILSKKMAYLFEDAASEDFDLYEGCADGEINGNF
jgi:hypothetical protein